MMPNPKDFRIARILLAEDNEDDVVLMRHAFEVAKLSVDLQHVENGQQCLAYLRRQPPYQDAQEPDLLLLDLNMPVLSGREVLAELVADETLNHIPVVILTTSAEQRDILNMYKLRCSSYIVKPLDFDQFMRVVRSIGDYWMTVVVLPRG